MDNKSLGRARKNKNDEFFTQISDIEEEIDAYIKCNKDLFRDKTILLPCDNPEKSNFTRFFISHFVEFGLKRLISTSYVKNQSDENSTIDDFKHGRILILNKNDFDSKSEIDNSNLKWSYLSGDGDFRSDEVTKLRDESDFVITNPPFSLFREFISWLMDSDGIHFSVIGNLNAVTYKNIFPLIKDNLLWLGATANTRGMVFAVPSQTPVKESYKKKAERLGYSSNDEYNYTVLGNSCWFTNISYIAHTIPLQLNTMSENLKNNKKLIKKLGYSGQYQRYDNYNAIDVPFTDSIPSDFDGVMGVPKSFLSKYDPEQFEIVGADYGDDGKRLKLLGAYPFSRILIRHRNHIN